MSFVDKIDKRVLELAKAKAGKNFDYVLAVAEEISVTKGKKPERALADALEQA